MIFSLKSIKSNKVVSWLVLLISSITCLITVFSLYILTKSASAISESSTQEIDFLYKINIVIVIVLSLTIFYLLFNTYKRYKQGIFGTKLMVKLAIFFSIVGIIPGSIVYTVSYKFVSTSLDAWFDTKKIDEGIDAGIELGTKFLDGLLQESTNLTVLLAKTYKDNSLEQLKEQIQFLNRSIPSKNYSLINLKGEVLYNSSENITLDMIDKVKNIGIYSNREVDDFSGNYKMRVIVPIGEINNPICYLQMVEQLPKEWADRVNKIEIGNRQHQVNKIGRNEFTNFYITTLTISLGFAICLSIVMAFWLGNQIIQPLLILEQNTKAVASGDLRPKEHIHTRDELGIVLQGFNHMIKQLSESRLTEQRNKNRLEVILTTMSSGVILLDNQQKLIRYNQSAQEILNITLDRFLQKTLSHDSLKDLLKNSNYNFRQQPNWKFEYEYLKPNNTISYLLITGNVIKNLDETQLLLVIDDLTQILSAQRITAWGEVAKRLAHEIKNPLTPIQLSAERIQMRLSSKLDKESQNLLQKSTNTIINQVNALKKLVDEFRHYSRLPHAVLEPISLNDLIQDIVHLYKSSNNIYWKLELNDIPNILVDIGQIRQVLHNLIQNAQDAMENTNKPKIEITTNLSQKGVHLIVADSGSGFDSNIIDKVFEPYITTKKTGTGLGMAIVKKVISENHAQISINNRIDNNNNDCIMGAEVHIWFRSI